MNKNRTWEISLSRISPFFVSVPEAGHKQNLEMRELFKTVLLVITVFHI